MTYREFVCDLAARDDGAFAEYVSGLRFPAHVREAYAFAAANPRAIMLMPVVTGRRSAQSTTSRGGSGSRPAG